MEVQEGDQTEGTNHEQVDQSPWNNIDRQPLQLPYMQAMSSVPYPLSAPNNNGGDQLYPVASCSYPESAWFGHPNYLGFWNNMCHSLRPMEVYAANPYTGHTTSQVGAPFIQASYSDITTTETPDTNAVYKSSSPSVSPREP